MYFARGRWEFRAARLFKKWPPSGVYKIIGTDTCGLGVAVRGCLIEVRRFNGMARADKRHVAT